MCQVVREGRKVRESFLPLEIRQKKNEGESKKKKQFGGSDQKKKKKKRKKIKKNEEEEKKSKGEPCVRGRGKREDLPVF